mmetsp:Transcript_74720/g.163249  ORF Transcript_74720/g.163249 Transcript_74720/m.163249 type:complete len:90 (+) Transcript_74720:331-600(+)
MAILLLNKLENKNKISHWISTKGAAKATASRQRFCGQLTFDSQGTSHGVSPVKQLAQAGRGFLGVRREGCITLLTVSGELTEVNLKLPC